MSEDKDWDSEDEVAIDEDEHERAVRAARWPELELEEGEPEAEDEELEKEIGEMIWAILPGNEKPTEKDT